MRIFEYTKILFKVAAVVLAVAGCTKVEEMHDDGYGYVQFKLLKSSYAKQSAATRAVERLEKLADALPFVHGAELEKALFRGDFQAAGSHLLTVAIYSALVTAAAVACFLRQMKQQ